MKYLTPEQVLFIHARLIAETGGAHGVRDLAMLESAVARPLAAFAGKDLYPDLNSKAAALLDSLINNHPFVDGNKRTGITSAALFISLNGSCLRMNNAEMEVFTLRIASSHPPLSSIADWFEDHSVTAGDV